MQKQKKTRATKTVVTTEMAVEDVSDGWLWRMCQMDGCGGCVRWMAVCVEDVSDGWLWRMCRMVRIVVVNGDVLDGLLRMPVMMDGCDLSMCQIRANIIKLFSVTDGGLTRAHCIPSGC